MAMVEAAELEAAATEAASGVAAGEAASEVTAGEAAGTAGVMLFGGTL